MSETHDVLVVGASAAGLSTAEALRRNGHRGRLTLLGAEEHVPYDRPPLSKQVLAGDWQPERARLRPEQTLSDLDAEFVLGDPAVRLDTAQRTVHTTSDRTLSADTVVVATGVRPRRLPVEHDLTGVHVLRTLDDALALRAGLSRSARLVVVGEGVLGAEIAATARKLGLDVTLAGPQSAPLANQLGPLVSGTLADLHSEHGVRLALGHLVEELTGEHGRVTGVRLDNGESLPADLVVVAIGAEPATAWLRDSGLTLDDGVVCDARCQAAPGVYAVGDVARWYHPTLRTMLRLENRTNATEQAQVVAANILGADRTYAPVPYFWTDQFDAKVQVYGRPGADDDTTVVEGDPADRRFVVRFERSGHVTGIVGWNMPKQARLRRREIVEALDAAPLPTT